MKSFLSQTQNFFAAVFVAISISIAVPTAQAYAVSTEATTVRKTSFSLDYRSASRISVYSGAYCTGTHISILPWMNFSAAGRSYRSNAVSRYRIVTAITGTSRYSGYYDKYVCRTVNTNGGEYVIVHTYYTLSAIK